MKIVLYVDAKAPTAPFDQPQRTIGMDSPQFAACVQRPLGHVVIGALFVTSQSSFTARSAVRAARYAALSFGIRTGLLRASSTAGLRFSRLASIGGSPSFIIGDKGNEFGFGASGSGLASSRPTTKTLIDMNMSLATSEILDGKTIDEIYAYLKSGKCGRFRSDWPVIAFGPWQWAHAWMLIGIHQLLAALHYWNLRRRSSLRTFRDITTTAAFGRQIAAASARF